MPITGTITVCDPLKREGVILADLEPLKFLFDEFHTNYQPAVGDRVRLYINLDRIELIARAEPIENTNAT